MQIQGTFRERSGPKLLSMSRSRRFRTALLLGALLALAAPAASQAGPCGFVSKDVLQPIPEPPPAFRTLKSSIYIPPSSNANYYLTDLDIRLNLRHPTTDQVDIFLTHDGITVELTTDNGGTGNNYIATRFDDEAAVSVTNGSAPFTGSYRPERPLSAFDNRDSTGLWTLTVSDDFPGETGTLDSWALDFDSVRCTPEDATLPPCYSVGRDLGAAIPEGQQGLYPLQVSRSLGDVEDVDVHVTIDHPATGELDVNLGGSSSAGHRIRLSHDNGGTGADYAATVFDDEAISSIDQGTAPFAGRFRPEQPLSGFDNVSQTSDYLSRWTLDVTDDTPNANRGSLTSWGLTVMLDDNGCTDLDEDQTPAAWDNCRSDSNPDQQDYDGDGSGDVCDSDDDNDRVQDARDACPQGSMFGPDTDRDGCRDDEDLDDDGDGIADTTDACPRGAVGPGADHDGDGCQDTEDADDDNDGRTDTADACPLGLVGPGQDLDGDGCRDEEDADDDGDGVPDQSDACPAVVTAGAVDPRGCPVSAGPTGGGASGGPAREPRRRDAERWRG